MRILPVLFLFWAETAYAYQGHAGPGVLPTHLIAHLIFLSSALFLVVYLRKRTEESMKRLRQAGLLFVLWNIITVSLHVGTDIYARRAGIPSIVSPWFPVGWEGLHPFNLIQMVGNVAEHIVFLAGLFFLLRSLQGLVSEKGVTWDTPPSS
ncbi:MAG: hypothetical protein D6713_04060 [Deltaproteobacteria bacterium]|nr:MAG: hypothetical protein D6713_04060 [Deltaproteobacteria bacterium]